MEPAVVVGFARTPFGRFLGSLKNVPAVKLGSIAIEAALERAGVPKDQVDQVLMGMVLQSGAGQIPSRQATISAGLPYTVPSDTINKVCASGLRTVNLGQVLIKTGQASILVAGGMENMSASPFLLKGMRSGYRMGDSRVIDAMIHDGLWCPFHDVHMGVHGSAVPAEHGITRQVMDQWALRSHRLAVEAMDNGRLAEEIVAVKAPGGHDEFVLACHDELPRRDTSLEKLARLSPAFEKEGMVTAGNAPGISDGAAAIVLTSPQKTAELDLKPLAEIMGCGSVAREPRYIATVPYEASEIALQQAGIKASQLALIEVNEAFAAVALTCIKLGGWNPELVNVNGGAVALGHPIGASGTRILLSLIAELRRRGGGYGLATICSGAAQGEATVVKVS